MTRIFFDDSPPLKASVPVREVPSSPARARITQRDELYRENEHAKGAKDVRGQFQFDEKTAYVFDDMLERSIPFYYESLRMAVEAAVAPLYHLLQTPAGAALQNGEPPMWELLDLGSSTGNFLYRLAERLERGPLGATKQFEGGSLESLDENQANCENQAEYASRMGTGTEPVSQVTYEHQENQREHANQSNQWSWHNKLHLIGIDNAPAMIHLAEQKGLARSETGVKVSFREDDLRRALTPSARPFPVPFVSMQYTLQFIPRAEKLDLLKKIAETLMEDGVLLLSEKLREPESVEEDWFRHSYEEFKQHQGYGVDEIARKRRALENVLIPLTWEDLCEMLHASGFTVVRIVFKWYNFTTIFAAKRKVRA